ncbi:methyl-accepting chemotaxis protein [Alkalicoccobacillus porphyridii]|nr:methyl-accepting chemotaxis protein [Alkalicoccobacillus porphyridii]
MKNKPKKSNRYKRGMSLRAKLIASFLFILIVPTSVIGFFAYDSARNNTESLIKQEADESIETLNQTINQYIKSQEENLDLLANVLSDTLEDQAVDTFIEQFYISQENVGQALIGTDSGTFIYHPSTYDYPESFDVRERTWYQQAKLNAGEIFVSAPYASMATGNMSITLSRALDDGSGVVAVDLELDDLTRMLESITVGKEGYMFLLDRNQSFISHPTQEAGTVAQDDFFARMYQDDAGQFEYIFESEDKYMSYLTNDVTGWKVAGTMFSDEVSEAVNPIFWHTLIVMGSTLIVGMILIIAVIRSITKPIHTLVKVAGIMGTGDLSEHPELRQNRKDEMGQLASAFEQMRVSFLDLLQGVLEKSTQVAAASEQLLASSEQNTKATEQITTVVQEVVSTTEAQGQAMENSSHKATHLSASIDEIEQHSAVTSTTAGKVQTAVMAGSRAVESSMEQMNTIQETSSVVSQRMNQLGESSREINQVTNVIKDIAEQTNLLALNASIEAARAGETGKGFAVVAEEVRKLAEQSAAANNQIKTIILKIQDQVELASHAMNVGGVEVEKGIQVAKQADHSFDQIDEYMSDMLSKINHVKTESMQISSDARQFVDVFKEVSASAAETSSEMQSVSASTEEQLASMEEISSSAESLTRLSEELQELVQVFKW